MVRSRLVWLAAALLLVGSACRSSRTELIAGHVDLGGDLEKLVSAFNAEEGKVRAILIASPT
jgi:hypothetical protein